ncbi:hypothetical protein HK097_001854, partial [Rhizophlyctis rosea]
KTRKTPGLSTLASGHSEPVLMWAEAFSKLLSCQLENCFLAITPGQQNGKLGIHKVSFEEEGVQPLHSKEQNLAPTRFPTGKRKDTDVSKQGRALDLQKIDLQKVLSAKASEHVIKVM